MNHDVGGRLQFLERRHAADVIEMRVGDGNRLQFKPVFVDRGDDRRGVVTGIDADRAFRLSQPSMRVCCWKAVTVISSMIIINCEL